jgi:hypothetical protein
MNQKHLSKLIVAAAIAAAFTPLIQSAQAGEIAVVGGMTNVESSVPTMDTTITRTTSESPTPTIEATIPTTSTDTTAETSVIPQGTDAPEAVLGRTTKNARKSRSPLSSIMGMLGAFFFDINEASSIINDPPHFVGF